MALTFWRRAGGWQQYLAVPPLLLLCWLMISSSAASRLRQASLSTTTSTPWPTEASLPDDVSGVAGALASVGMTVRSIDATFAWRTTEWECYHWSKRDEAQLGSDGSEDLQRLVCERLRGDGYFYAFSRATARCGDCRCCRIWMDATRRPEDIPHPYAFVTMAYNPHGASDDSLWGALAMAKSLQKFSRYPLLVLSNTTTFNDGTTVKRAFARLGARVLPCRKVDLTSKLDWTVQRWSIALWKLQVWQLTSFEKLVWLDADALLFRPIDWIFDRHWMWAQRDAWFCNLDAERLCSGLMLLYPDDDDYAGLANHFQEVSSKLTRGDQELIELYFRNVKKRPIQLLSPLEASFGQCAGTAKSPYVLETGGEVEGIWSIPAFVHKSGGWGNTVDNDYNNVCFTHNIAQQLYRRGDTTINVCHVNPLAGFWRRTFCEAVKIGGIKVQSVAAFCNDRCYYSGAGGPARCPSPLPLASGALEANLPDADSSSKRKSGWPLPEFFKENAPYKFDWAYSSQWEAITYKGARLPPPPFSIVGAVKPEQELACQEILAWFGDDGKRSVELQLLWGDLLYGENSGQWKQVRSVGQGIADGKWHSFAVVRSMSGSTGIYVDGWQVASGAMTAEAPGDLDVDPRSARPEDCSLVGEVRDLRIYDVDLSPEGLAMIM